MIKSVDEKIKYFDADHLYAFYQATELTPNIDTIAETTLRNHIGIATQANKTLDDIQFHAARKLNTKSYQVRRDKI